ncbi:hypothetical protein BKA65DRAFT_589459 [Rhexocercosporidium sp. MPI-PUGE-AT-0058]|nr:hypothetical protein BKA65DRAFT_589459 [Rhexocercosporidium sp. MPI-PUGE-AT-0058]
MTKIQVRHRLPGTALLVLLNVFTAVALFFEGYNQSVLGTVFGTTGFIDMAGIGSNGVVTDTTKQGGLAAVYYFGAMKKGVFVGAVLCMLGGALMASGSLALDIKGFAHSTNGNQCGSVNSNVFICARVIAGLGIGFINSIIPSWVSELSQARNCGSSFSLIFIAIF